MTAPNGSSPEPTETSPLLQRTLSQELPISVGIMAPADGAEDALISNGATNGDIEEALSGEPDDGTPKSSVKLHWLLPAVGIGIFLSAADQTIIVSSYGKIGSELNALNNTSWIATIYFLTLTSFQPLYGKLSDIFGRKECLLFSYAIFGLGCVFCGLARDITELIVARGFSGIGGGGMTTVVSILLSDVVPLRDRGLWQGYVNIIYAVGSSSGAPLGGFLVDAVSWRYAFILQGPLCLVAFVAVYFILEDHHDHDSHWREKLRQIDFLGAFILVAAVFCLLLGLDHGSNVAWNNKVTIISCSLAIPLLLLFVFVEKKIAQHPFAPGHIILERSLIGCYLCNLFAFAGYFAALFYVPLLFEAVDRLNAAQSGARIIPAVLGSVTGSVFSGAVMRRTGKYYWLTITSYSFAFVGLIFVLLFTGIIANSNVGIIVSLTFCAFGCGIGVTTTLIGLIANASTKDQAIATACSYLFRSLGSVIGVSLSAGVVQQLLRAQLTTHLPEGAETEKIIENVRHNLEYINELEPAVAKVVRVCYQMATRGAFTLSFTLMAGAVISAFFIRETKLNK